MNNGAVNLDECVKNILIELAKTRAKPDVYTYININPPKIENEIQKIASIFKSNIKLKREIKDVEWECVIREALNKILNEIEVTENLLDKNTELVRRQLNKEYKSFLPNLEGKEFVYSCTLFNIPVESFAVGPVRFETQEDWFKRKEPELESSKYYNSWKDDIVKTVREGLFVCSVETKGLSIEKGHDNALFAARLAMVSIALLWNSPSKALDGMNLLYDRKLYMQRYLVLAPDKPIRIDSRKSHMPANGGFQNEKEWKDLFDEKKDHLQIAGR